MAFEKYGADPSVIPPTQDQLDEIARLKHAKKLSHDVTLGNPKTATEADQQINFIKAQ